MPVCLSVCLLYLSVCPFIHSSVYLFIYLFIYLFMCLLVRVLEVVVCRFLATLSFILERQYNRLNVVKPSID